MTEKQKKEFLFQIVLLSILIVLRIGFRNNEIMRDIANVMIPFCAGFILGNYKKYKKEDSEND